MKNPYNKGTKIYDTFEILQDGNKHCAKCELPAGQAKTFEKMRDDGYIFKQSPTNPNYFCTWDYCKKCGCKRIHRKIIGKK